jgi:hypothetical protein
MRRLPIVVAGVAMAAAPAAWGLIGNSSFSQNLPVQVPPQVQVAQATAHLPTGGTPATPPSAALKPSARAANDGHTAQRAGTPAKAPTNTRGSDRRVAAAGGERSQQGARGRAVQAAEPGDDRGRQAEPGDDKAGRVSTSGPAPAPASPSGSSGRRSGSGGGGSGGGHDDGSGHQ